MIPVVVGSNPIGHPKSPRKWKPPSLDAGTGAGEAFAAIAGAALAQIGANAAGAAAGRDPEALHQLRVGVRRLRSALHAFRALLRRRAAARVERPWRSIVRTLGRVRDLDVMLGELAPGPLRNKATRLRKAAQAGARALLRSPRFDGARDATQAAIRRGLWRKHADPGQALDAFAPRALRNLQRKLERSAAGIDWRNAARRHRVRIRVKRMRYGCDSFRVVFAGRGVRRYLDGLHLLQDLLGELNDIDMQRRLLREMARKGSAPRLARARAAAGKRLAAREHELVAALVPAWDAFEALGPFWRAKGAARERE